MRRGGVVRTCALALALGLGAGCDGADESLAVDAPAGRGPSEGMRGVSVRNFHEGDTRWLLHADTASVFRDRKRVETERVEIEFFDGDRRISTLTANRGVLLQATDDLEARGNVRVVAEDGAVLRTEVLFWDHRRSRIHTDDPVTITRGDDVLRGVGLEADPGLDRVDLKREVRGTVRSDPEALLPAEGAPGG
jgi:LPS export ABC transporter protein LptC